MATLALAVGAGSAQAAALDPDPSFGDGGHAKPSYPSTWSGHTMRAVAVQGDHKVVVAGRVNQSHSGDFAVARFQRDGRPDPMFGSGGTAITSFGDNEEAQAVAVQPDGKLIAAGGPEQCPGCAGFGFEVVRYRGDGTLDPTFSGDGKQRIAGPAFGTKLNAAFDVLVQPDGKLVLAGLANGKFAVVRLTAAGGLDRTFDGDGIAYVDSPAHDAAYAAGIQADGKIVVAGISGPNGMVARLTTAGRPDTSFGTGGKVISPFNSSFRAIQDLLIQPNGAIVVAGQTTRVVNQSSDGDFIVARYTPAGGLDPTFSGDGIAKANFSMYGAATDNATSVALQPDGKLLALGYAGDRAGFARFLPDGTPDPGFGDGGIVISQAPSSAFGAALQPDGELLVADGVGVTRYLMDASWQSTCDSRPATIVGTSGADTLVGTEGADVIVGRGGNDRIEGRGANDTVCANDGDDTVLGGTGSDVLRGRRGNDVLEGGAGDDLMDGAQGTDVASFSTSAAPVVAASSSLGKSSATGDGADTLVAIEGLVGSSHDDLLYGDEGPNQLHGSAGRDLLAGKGGSDRVDGGGDVDTASFETAQTLINADLGMGQAVGDYGISSLVSIENLIGSRWNDTLVGSTAANRIAGGDGNDAIGGSYGADVLAGEAGADRLSGGPDVDACDGGTNPVGSADTADQTCEATAGIP
jgi:uncharacterized delta-60 repeat protein